MKINGHVFAAIFSVHTSCVTVSFRHQFITLRHVTTIHILLNVLRATFRVQGNSQSIQVIVSHGTRIKVVVYSTRHTVKHRHRDNTPATKAKDRAMLSNSKLRREPDNNVQSKVEFLNIYILTYVFTIEFLALNKRTLSINIFRKVPIKLSILRRVMNNFITKNKLRFSNIVLKTIMTIMERR